VPENNWKTCNHYTDKIVEPLATLPTMPITSSFISISGALKRLQSPDFALFDAASRRVAWDSIMSSGNKKQLRDANEARDLYSFTSTPAIGEVISE
jgi:hypothetical protein